MSKYTKQREAIVRILKNTPSHPSAEWIYEQVKQELPDIGFATVYRNLRLLKRSGEVLEIHTASDAARFDGCTTNHYHFCCDRCGKILDLDEPVDTGMDNRLAEKTGLKITHHSLVFNGLCLECQQHPDDAVKN